MLVRIAYRSLTILCSKAPVTMTVTIAGQSLEGISNPTIIPVANVTVGPRSAARQRAVNPLASQGGTGSRGAARSYSEKRLFMFHAPSEATQQSFLLFTTSAVGGRMNCLSLRKRQKGDRAPPECSRPVRSAGYGVADVRVANSWPIRGPSILTTSNRQPAKSK